MYVDSTVIKYLQERKKLGCRHSSVDSSAPSILPPRFESQAHHLRFYQFIFELCHVEKTKINKKRQGLVHFLNASVSSTAPVTTLVQIKFAVQLVSSSTPANFTAIGQNICLVVMGGDSCSEGCGFESKLHVLDGHLSQIYVVKIVMFV